MGSSHNVRTSLLGLLLTIFCCALILGPLTLMTPSPALGQEGGEAPPPAAPEGGAPGAEEKKAEMDNPIVHFFKSIGLIFGAIFALLSIGTVALIIILLMELRLGEAIPPAFVEDFTGMVNKRQFKQAYDLCKNDSSYLARVLTAGMSRLQYGIEDAREAMFGMIDTVRASKDGWVSYLAAIGTLGPMLGLVGTVAGMIGAFRKLGASTKAPDPSELAGEISHALVVTLVGVAISVPAIFFFTFFKNRLTALANNTSNLADDLLTQMYHNTKKPADKPVAATATNVQGKA